MKLPFATFLVGPRLSCQILAADLSQTDAELMQVSLRTPVEAALCATFFENDPSLAIHDNLELPFTVKKASEFIQRYSDFVRSAYGDYMLGRLAVRGIEENADYFERFVVLDGEPDEIRFMVEHFGRNRSLVLHIDSPRPPIPAGITTLGYDNFDPCLSTVERIRHLTALLEPTP